MIGFLRARALRQVPTMRLQVVADVDRTAATKVAATSKGVEVLSDGTAVAGREDVDAVVLATPPHTHEALGIACLRGGKHVLCEKPLATSVEACQRLVEAARQAGVVLATGFNLRYTPAAQLARRLLDGGAIGKLDHIRAYHGHPGGTEFTHNWITVASAMETEKATVVDYIPAYRTPAGTGLAMGFVFWRPLSQ